MYLSKLLAPFLVTIIAVSVSVSAVATPAYLTRPGTIAHALLQPAETEVYLDSVIVDKIKARQNPAYFVVRESWNSQSRIVVNTAPPEVLRMGQMVDIEGTVSFLSNGERAIVASRIAGYCDAAGNLLPYAPTMKSPYPLLTSPWPHKQDLVIPPNAANRSGSSTEELDDDPLPPPEVYNTIADLVAADLPVGTGVELRCKPIASDGSDETYGDYIVMGEDATSDTVKVYISSAPDPSSRIATVVGQVSSENDDLILCVNSGPGYDLQGYPGSMLTAAPGTIAFPKTQPYGTIVTLSGKVVTAAHQDGQGTETFYIQEQPGVLGSDGHPHDYSGIKVTCSGASVVPGDVVSVTGPVRGDPTYPESYVAATSATVSAVASVPTAPGMSQKATAGGLFGLQPALSRRTANPALPGVGLNPTGIRARLWGNLVYGSVEGSHYVYYIDDGSQIRSNAGHNGLRVVCWTTDPMPGWQVTNPPQYVQATGVLGAEFGEASSPVPILRVDSTPPSTPVVADDGTYTASTTQLHATWAAEDAESGIVRYEYAIGIAAYPSTGWNTICGWTDVGTDTEATATGISLAATMYYFSVRATNGTGLTSVGSSDGITVDSNAPRIGAITDNAGDYTGGQIPQYEKYEASFTIQTKGETSPGSKVFASDPNGYNPFSPRLEGYDYTSSHAWAGWPGLYVDAIVLKPNGQQIRWPCFYDYSRGWKFRFAPTGTGLWSYRIEVRHRPAEMQGGVPADGSVTYVFAGPSKSFTCVSNTTGWSKRGFLRVDSSDCRFFSFSEADFASPSDDTVFYPFGVKCNSTTDIDSFSSQGGTYSRLFRASRMFEQQYTGTQPDAGDRVNDFRNTDYTPVSRDADWWDTFIERARNRGIYLIYLLNDWDKWSKDSQTTGENVYVREGVASNKDDSFSPNNTIMREVYKRKLRWAIARWSYATSIIGFDLINECQQGDSAQDFHNDMAGFISGDEEYWRDIDNDGVVDEGEMLDVMPDAWPVRNNFLEEQPHLATGSLSSDHYRYTNEAVDWRRNRVGMGTLHSYARTNYSGGSPFYGNMVTEDPPNGLDDLGSQLTYAWQDSAMWADRAVRMHRRSGFAKPFSWTEFGCAPPNLSGDWTTAYQGDSTAQHAKDWIWGLLLTGGSGSHWLPGYFNGDFNGGTTHWGIFKPLSNYLSGVDFRGMTQESSYRNTDETNADGTLNPNPHVISSNHLVGVYCMRGSDKAYMYAKNLTSTWYYNVGFRNLNVPTPVSQSANITIKGLQASTTYTIDRWSTTDSTNQVKGTITRTTDSSGGLVFPVNWNSNGNAVDIGATTDYDWAYNIYR